MKFQILLKRVKSDLKFLGNKPSINTPPSEKSPFLTSTQKNVSFLSKELGGSGSRQTRKREKRYTSNSANDST